MGELKINYRCGNCGRTEEIPADKPAPECCGEIMKKFPLDKCTTADHPEMVRNSDDSEPCDDGRG